MPIKDSLQFVQLYKCKSLLALTCTPILHKRKAQCKHL